MIKGFFFDLDGTLVNTYEADYLAYRDAVLEVTGIKILQDKYASLHGMEIGAKLAKLIPGLSDDQIGAIRKSKKRQLPNYLHLTVPNKPLIQFLEQFARHQYCSLVTTAKRDNAASVMRQHGLEQFFTHVITGDDVTSHKPHPEAYHIALDKSGLQSHEAIAFEDSDSGIRAAEAAGIPVIHVKEFAMA